MGTATRLPGRVAQRSYFLSSRSCRGPLAQRRIARGEGKLSPSKVAIRARSQFETKMVDLSNKSLGGAFNHSKARWANRIIPYLGRSHECGIIRFRVDLRMAGESGPGLCVPIRRFSGLNAICRSGIGLAFLHTLPGARQISGAAAWQQHFSL